MCAMQGEAQCVSIRYAFDSLHRKYASVLHFISFHRFDLIDVKSVRSPRGELPIKASISSFFPRLETIS